MADEKKVTISVPADVVEVLDKRAKTVKFSREQFIVALIEASVGIIDPAVGPDPSGMIPVTIGFSIGSVRDYHRAAQIMGVESAGLISAALEHGRKVSLSTAREFAKHVDAEKPLPN